MAIYSFLGFCPSVSDELSWSGLWNLRCSDSPGAGLGASVSIIGWPQAPVARITAAKRLPLSGCLEQTSCVLPEARLPVCCHGLTPPHGGPGGVGMGAHCRVFSKASTSLSGVGLCLIF